MNLRQLNYDVRQLRRCMDCYGKLDGKYEIEYSPNRVFARHKDFGICFRFAVNLIRSRRGKRRAKRRWRKHH
jgi:hypothetical protein